MVFVNFYYLRVVLQGSFREQLGVVVVRRRSSVLSIGEHSRKHVDIVKRDLSFVAESEVHLSLHFGMNSLIKTNSDVFTRFPFEAPLPGDDIVGIDLLSSKLFYS